MMYDEAMLQAELVSFVQEGVAIMMATRNQELQARGSRGYGIFVHENLKELTVYINAQAFEIQKKNLLENGEMSLALGRPTDYRAIQIKGKYLSHRELDGRDKILVQRYLDLFIEEVVKASGDRLPYMRMPALPAVAVTMKIEVVYNQTPGAASGERLT